MLGALKEVLKSDPDIVPVVVNDVDCFPACHGLQAKVILALGKGPQDFLTSIGALRKKATITSLRGQAYAVGTHLERVMVSYSPLIAEIDYGMYIDLLCDTKMAMRFAKTGVLTPPVGDYQYVENFDGTLAAVEQKWKDTGKPVEVAFDTETLGLDPYHPDAYFVALQMSHAPGQAEVRYFTTKKEMEETFRSFAFMDSFATLLSSRKVSIRAANGKYDNGWLWAMAGLRPTNFKFDTTLVGSLLDENRSNALDIHAKIYTDMGGYSDVFDKSVDKSRMDLVPKESMLPYAGGDTDATLQVSSAQKSLLLEDKELTNFYVNLLHPAARAFEKVEQVGVCVDREAYRELEADLNTALNACIQKAKKIVGGIMVARHLVESQNIIRPKFLIDFMFGPDGLNLKPKMWTDGGKDGLGEKKPSTAMEHLFMFASDPKAKEFVDILKEYSSASKTLSTYVIGFQSHIRADARMHPSYMLHRGNKDEGEGGTVTGRLSARDPAFQTIPKHTKWAKAIRRCFVAPPGQVILAFDYSQGELRVIACLANDPTMIQAYKDGMDLHSLTAGRFKGYTYEQMMKLKNSSDPDEQEMFEEIRQLGKAGNFGLIYGMGVDGFMIYAESNYGVKLPRAEAAAFRDGFFDTYAQLPVYHENYIAFARQNGFVPSPLGRKRHLPLIRSPRRDVSSKAERQAINAPVQSCLSDMGLLCSAELDRMGYFDWAPQFGAVHDQNLFYCPEEKADDHAKLIKQVAENLPLSKFGWAPQLTFVADVTYGINLADQKKVKI